MERLGCRYVVGPSPNFLALPGLLGEAAWAVGKSRSGKKLTAVAKRFGFSLTLKCQGQFFESQKDVRHFLTPIDNIHSKKAYM